MPKLVTIYTSGKSKAAWRKYMKVTHDKFYNLMTDYELKNTKISVNEKSYDF